MYTKPNCERKATKFLSDRNIEYFLPIKEILSKRRDGYKLVKKLLFPSYFFVKLRNDEEYIIALSNQYSNYFALLGNGLVESVRIAIEETDEYEIVCSFKPGQKVFIKEGAFAGLQGELVELKGKRKIQLYIKEINRAILVTINQDFVCVINRLIE